MASHLTLWGSGARCLSACNCSLVWRPKFASARMLRESYSLAAASAVRHWDLHLGDVCGSFLEWMSASQWVCVFWWKRLCSTLRSLKEEVLHVERWALGGMAENTVYIYIHTYSMCGCGEWRFSTNPAATLTGCWGPVGRVDAALAGPGGDVR